MKLTRRNKNQLTPAESFRQEMNDVFRRFFGDSPLFATSEWEWPETLQNFQPKINVAETDKAIEVSAELPGMSEEDVDVTLHDNVLTIKGEKKEETKQEEGTTYHYERSFGSFQRTIPLDTEVDEENIQANFKNGVLNINLPKSPKAIKESKKIAINRS